jgi:dihydrofolate synthase/folylpolyglutamate synthase
MTTYPDSVRYLYSLGNEIRTVKLGLGRMQVLFEELGHPERACRLVHVAGTNGKGSTCAMIESSLRAAGFRTGLYTSPHLVEPTERIQVNGEPVSEELFAGAFDRVHQKAEQMLRREELDSHPTYFETVTAMAMLLFRNLGVETAVLEVGLGGRLDATNVVHPRVTVITPIDFDHETHLGNSLRSIAEEKAGILKAGVPAVFSRQRPEVMEALQQRAGALGISVARTDDWRVEELELHRHGSRFLAAGPRTAIRVECPLPGEHQVENALTAAVALLELGVGIEAVEKGVRQVRWPGRLETVSTGPEIILDGAHNPAGIRALASYIERFYSDRRVWLICGAMRDKSLDEIAGILSPVAGRIIVTTPGSHRALRPESMRRLFDHPSVETATGMAQALSMVKKASPEDAIFITGSLLLVGEARELLCRTG